MGGSAGAKVSGQDILRNYNARPVLLGAHQVPPLLYVLRKYVERHQSSGSFAVAAHKPWRFGSEESGSLDTATYCMYCRCTVGN